MQQLAALAADNAVAEAYLAPRHVIDVLRDFRPARLGAAELLGVLRQLQPRLYSISSSQVGPAGLVGRAGLGMGKACIEV